MLGPDLNIRQNETSKGDIARNGRAQVQQYISYLKITLRTNTHCYYSMETGGIYMVKTIPLCRGICMAVTPKSCLAKTGVKDIKWRFEIWQTLEGVGWEKWGWWNGWGEVQKPIYVVYASGKVTCNNCYLKKHLHENNQ